MLKSQILYAIDCAGKLYGTLVTAMIAVLFVGVWGVVWTIPAAMRIQSREATPIPEVEM